jgi:hypothetical protein
MILKALGLSVGDLHVTLERSEYAPGDRLRGAVRLELTGEVPARRLVVGLRATQRSFGVGLGLRSRGRQVTYSNDKAYEFAKELSGERTYSTGEVLKFELLVPEAGARPQIKPPEGVLGDLTQIAAALTRVYSFPLEWRVFAFLDRPWQLNPTGEAQFQLLEAPRSDGAGKVAGDGSAKRQRKKPGREKSPAKPPSDATTPAAKPKKPRARPKRGEE